MLENMDSDLQRAYDVLNDATCAEDVFGDLVDREQKLTTEQVLEREYRKLAAIADPDLYKGSPNDKDVASDLQQKLDSFYRQAKLRLADGMYGQAQRKPRLMNPGHVAFETGKRRYYLGDPIAEGTIATVFDGECAYGDDFAGRVAVKIAGAASDNELMARELRTLKLLHAGNGAQRKHLPILLDSFRTDDGRAGSVFRYLEDCYDLVAVRDNPRYQAGVDQKDMVWMLNRLLSAIGYAHSLGVVHGNIEPAHVFIRPRNHNAFLIDWSWSAIRPKETGDNFLVETPGYSAPEVARKRSPTPAADLYSIGKCMIFVLGGNPETNEVPDTVEEPIARILKYLVLDSPRQRAQDAWEMWHILDKTVRELWGPKKFREFPM